MKPEKGKIYLIPTLLAPDTTSRVLPTYVQQLISQIDFFLVEEIRTARRFISSLKLGKNIDDINFFLLNKDTTSEILEDIWRKIPEAENIGIMSEAGCPGIADPGSLAVLKAHKSDRQVVPLVGPSSIFLALMASGFNGQSFAFHGYLPIERAKRIKMIKMLENESAQINRTQIIMETPYRNNNFLQDILDTCNAGTWLCIACNVSGEDEMIQTKKISEWKQKIPDLHKKPTIFILYRR